MKEKKRWVVQWDFDSVLVDTSIAVLEAFNERFGEELGREVTIEEIESYSWLIYKAAKLSGEEPAVVAAWLYGSEVMAKVPAYEEMVRLSATLALAGVRQVVATSRPASQGELTLEQVRRFFPWIEAEDVYIRPEGEEMSGEEYKLWVREQVGSDLVVDDSGETIRYMAGKMTEDSGVEAMLLDQPWNRSFEELERYRVENAEKLRMKFEELMGEELGEMLGLMEMGTRVPAAASGVLDKVARRLEEMAETVKLAGRSERVKHVWRREFLDQLEKVLEQNPELGVTLVWDLDGTLRDQRWSNLWRFNWGRFSLDDMAVVNKLKQWQEQYDLRVLVVTNQVRHGHQAARIMAGLKERRTGKTYHWFPKEIEERFELHGSGRPIQFLWRRYKKQAKSVRQAGEWVMNKEDEAGKKKPEMVIVVGNESGDARWAVKLEEELRNRGSRDWVGTVLLEHNGKSGFEPRAEANWLSQWIRDF